MLTLHRIDFQDSWETSRRELSGASRLTKLPQVGLNKLGRKDTGLAPPKEI
jgi:hypothetical protein